MKAAVDFRWDDLRVFLAILRGRSFTAAGKALGIDVSTASRRLTALEEAVGVRLFERTPDGLVPTSAAEELGPAAERTEAAALEAARIGGAYERQPVGLVRLACLPTVAELFVAPRVPELRRRHPGLRLELDARVSIADLTRNEADLAIRTVRPHAGDLVSQRLGTYVHELVAERRLARRLGTIDSFAEVPLIAWGAELSGTPAARWLRQVAPGASPILQSNSLSVLLAAVRAGAGAAVLARPLAALYKDLAPVTLAAALTKRASPPEESLWLIGHSALRGVPRVAVVWDSLVSWFGEGLAKS